MISRLAAIVSSIAVTPSDSADLATPCRAIIVGTTGNVKLTFDRRNYVLGPHRDHVSRFISCLFFLPFSDGNPEIGTSIYRPLKAIEYFDWGRHHPFEEFELLRTFPYKPNACLAFLNFGKPYHGVQKVQTDAMRRLLQYTLYITPDGKPQPDLQR